MILKYRKKPVVIEAIQLTKYNIDSVYKFIHGEESIKLVNRMAEERWEMYEDSVRDFGLKLKTLESDGETQTAAIGDFIIKGVQGEFYPCKPDIFKLTYESDNENSWENIIDYYLSCNDDSKEYNRQHLINFLKANYNAPNRLW